MANNRRSSNPTGVIFALLMLIVIVVALVIVLRSCQAPGGENTDTPPADTGGSVVGPGPGDTGSAPETSDPGTVTTVPPVTAPPTPSATPESTPSPTPSPTPVPSSSGSVRSDTGTGLNIVADWSLSGTTLNVSVSAESYSLFSQGAWHGCTVTVGGQTAYIDTKAIEYDGQGLVTNPLGSVTLSGVQRGSRIEVTWLFQGTYGGTELERITASGTIS